MKKLQKLTGFLNFLCRCVVPGRALTRRIYSHYSSLMLPHHHVWVNLELKQDLSMWIEFLTNAKIYCRPFIDFTKILIASELFWFTDASGKIGYGGIFEQNWFKGSWLSELLQAEPSIEFLELYGLTMSVFLWAEKVSNRRICLFCDNQAVGHMVNNSTSSCKNCMKLIRKLTLKSLEMNIRVFAKYVEMKQNYFLDALSRNQMDQFRRLGIEHGREFNSLPDETPSELMPILSKFWQTD